MFVTIKHGSLLAAGVLSIALVAGQAHAGKPMNVQQKKAAADAMAREYQARQASAASTPVTLAGSGDAAAVPDDLHNYLHAQVEANGKIRVLETDGPTAPAKEANDE